MTREEERNGSAGARPRRRERRWICLPRGREGRDEAEEMAGRREEGEGIKERRRREEKARRASSWLPLRERSAMAELQDETEDLSTTREKWRERVEGEEGTFMAFLEVFEEMPLSLSLSLLLL